MLGDAGLIDEIPCQERDVAKARDHGGDECALPANGLLVEVRIHASEHVR